MLDTKLKNNKKGRIIGILISLLLIGIVSTCAIASYPIIKKNTEKLMARYSNETSIRDEEIKYFKSRFIEALYKSNYVLYMNSRQKNNARLTPADIFLNYNSSDNTNVYLYDEEYECFVQYFNQALENWNNRFYTDILEELPSFKYYFLDNRTEKSLTNSIDTLHMIMDETDESEAIKASYPFYIVFQYMEDGKLQILDYKGLEQEYIDEYKLLELNKNLIGNEINDVWWYKYKDNIYPISNATFIYASDSEEFYLPKNIVLYRYDSLYGFRSAGFGFVTVVSTLCIVMLALILPIKKSWGIGSGFSSRIPFEISVIALVFALCQYPMISSMALETTTGYFISDPQISIIPENILNILDYILNFAIWFEMLALVFISTLSIRQVFTLGFKKYIKEKTLTGRFVLWVYAKIKNLIRSVGQIDLSAPSNKSIIKILAVNFVILLVLCSIWVFGILLLIVYSIVLFFALRKYLDDIKRKYTILLDGTIKIAEGNLDHTIEEDLGIFEPLKDELTKVQYGFRKAVEEEMKSQRMKTDLITNVSHDLKTPLTAIITYVNLLKDENISEDDRKLYIETLDNKSQRLKRLIDDLFEISKASSNNITLDPVDVDLIDLIKQVLLEIDDKIKESGIDFRFNPPMEKLILKLDSEKTYRIFENLIINIIKYGMPNTRAYIDIMKEGDTVRIVLKNVSASELNFSVDEISERFVRGDQSRNTDGSGLGLAIAKSFVQLQKGQFRVETDGDLFKVIIEWKMQ